jgi:prepilin-type N-terminal cleavage/methylation domain-containing protein
VSAIPFARLRRRLSAESGLSLIEMLVAMMLSGILLAMVGTLFVTIARSTTTSNLSREASTVAGNAANAMSKSIRFAVQNRVQGQLALDPAVVAATPTTLTIYTLAETQPGSPAPTMVRFRVSGTQLLEERWPATDTGGFWTFAGGAPTGVRPLGAAIVASAGQPLFRYLDSAGAELVPGAGGLTAGQRADVTSITVVVRARSASSSDAPVAVVENTVGMPNLAYSGEAD